MKRLLLLAALLVGATAGPSRGSVIVVDCSGGGDYLTLREGIAAATDGDTVEVAPGTYSGPDNRGLDFEGKAITVVSEAGPRDTIIDCQNAGRAFDFHSAEPMTARLSGLTITHGSADEGGAIRCRSASRPSIDRCVLSGNWGAAKGGGLCVLSSAGPILSNVVFDGNESGGQGGAISAQNSRTVIDSCTFYANSAPDGGALFLYYDMYVFITDSDFTGNSAGVGGGIYDFGSSPSVTGSTFRDNHVSGDGYNFGGGMQSVNSNNATVTDCVFADNSAHGYVGFGGGLSIDMARVLVADCTFSGNTATGSYGAAGGGVYCYNEDDNWGPPSEFARCDFVGNASEQGGGFCCENTSAPITECVFSHNRAHHGGGVYLAHHGGHFEDCVIFDNESPEFRGGGMYVWACTSLIRNVTVSGNSGLEGGGIYLSTGPSPYIGNSVIAFNKRGSGLRCHPDADDPLLECCDVYGNAGGDWIDCIAGLSGINGNLSDDPLFCGAPEGDFSIGASSPCAPAMSPLCGLIGALGVGCETSVIRPVSWGAIKARFR